MERSSAFICCLLSRQTLPRCEAPSGLHLGSEKDKEKKEGKEDGLVGVGALLTGVSCRFIHGCSSYTLFAALLP